MSVRRLTATLREPYAPLDLVAFSCCTWRSDFFRTTNENLARFELNRHLKAEHPAEYGVCGQCGALTDYLRIVAEPDGVGWLCQMHAPAPDNDQLRAAMGGTQ